MKKNKNDEGSALVWVLVVCVVFTILGMSIGWVALSMNKRSSQNYVLRQSYFTSRSAIETLVNQLNGYDTDYDASLCKYLNTNLLNGKKTVEFQDFFGTQTASDENIKNMGECYVSGHYVNGQIEFEARTGSGAEGTVKATAYRKCLPANMNWPNTYWASDLTQVGDKIKVGESTTADKFKDLDVAVYKVDSGKSLEGNLTITKDAASEKKAIFIYIERSATLSLEGMSVEDPVNAESSVNNWFADGNTGNWKRDNYYGPDIFIYLEEGTTEKPTTLNFKTYNGEQTNPYGIYVAGNGNDLVVTKDATLQPVPVYCSQSINTTAMIFEEIDSAPARIPISGYYYAGAPASNEKKEDGSIESGLIADVWQVKLYESGGQ